MLTRLRSLLSFQDAKKDDAVRKAYKYLAALHEVRGAMCLVDWLWRASTGTSKPCILIVSRIAASSSRPLRTQAPS